MLHILNVILSFVEDTGSLVPRIARHDPDLARQLRRASTAVALNTAEGSAARGRSRAACYNIALREMRECHTALQIAVRLRYLPPLSTELEARCQQILATLYKLSFPRAAA